ncbi:prepilin-type N-terminal cleavage/methylation domain-containing protein [Heliobacillus mobilis]|uniref:Prepilin-type N-terminal cleavage/methylation domain-containing protein n=1 Tax=Heliobacterium mobile TaxID=28064 RepID=A0A6I3SKA7_HELMO|nr:prepilin-type N-terminal cleavage/methylation domain-containing protein [Heliobacterium mobile]MTV49378.1 prepilin-type N-terminal cleavage/methylation domain-containing protein [Heliobacterium mobile]
MDKSARTITQHSNKGMTLIEVLVAITILTILIVSFSSMLSINFSNIFIFGEQSKAIAKAKEKTDELYSIVWSANNPATASAALTNPSIGWKRDYDSLFESPTTAYYFETKTKTVDGTPIQGYEVSVVVPYEEGKYHVELKSFIEDVN